MSTPTYNRIIRKLVVGFGNLFNDITLVRYNPDLSEAQRMLVPIVYAAKEMYVKRLEDDPNLDKKVQMTLPKMSFEMMGMTYDASRKQNTNIKGFAQTSSGVVSQYNPVPYNFDFNLYIYVRNIEDGTQIIEHILPFFAPDYTIKLNLVPEMGIVKEIPIVLNSANQEIEYEGDAHTVETRMIIWTLNFTVKGFVYGAISSAGLIKTSITNIFNEITPADTVLFNMTTPGIGTYQIGELVYQGYSLNTATASGKVIYWTNNTLTLTNINGNFVSNLPIVGAISNSNYVFNSYQVQPLEYAQIVTTPNPSTANATSSYLYNTTITETGNSGIGVIPPSAHSLLFNGSNYLTLNPGFIFDQSPLTIETWFYPTQNVSGSTLIGTTNGYGLDAYFTDNNTLDVAFYGDGNNHAWTLKNSGTITTNTWHHIAITRDNAYNMTVFLDGVRANSGVQSVSVNYTGDSYTIGQGFVGYLSNMRVVIGSNVYDPTQTTITVPTSTLSTVLNTQYLMLGNNPITDTSSNQTITNHNNVTANTPAPF